MYEVRDDLAVAHDEVWADLGRPGACWTGEQRAELAATVVAALHEDDPPPPWVPMVESGRLPHVGPAGGAAGVAAHDIAARIAVHAGTVTLDIAQDAMGQLGEFAYVELCSLVSSVAAIDRFDRAVGRDRRPGPTVVDGAPTGEVAASVAAAELNWVPVAIPADEVAAVVQAYTAVPPADRATWRLAAAQYMSGEEMADPAWQRRSDGLTRPEMELVASRVAQLRECFY